MMRGFIRINLVSLFLTSQQTKAWRLAATPNVLKRPRPRPGYKNGYPVPPTSSFYEEPKYRTAEYPTIAEMALLHRHFAATSQAKDRGVRSKRQLADMAFEFSWRYAEHIIEGEGWGVRFDALGCPDGWRYRYCGKHGDIALMRVALERIRRRFDHYQTDFPFAIKLPRAHYWKAKAWCTERYPAGSFCYHHGSWRFVDQGSAFEMKLNWG